MQSSVMLTVTLAMVVLGGAGWRFHRRRVAEMTNRLHAGTRALEEANRFLGLVFEVAPASMLLVDEDQRVVRANRAAARLHGAEVGGRPCHELVLGREERCALCPSAMGLPGPGCDGERSVTRSGEVFSVESHRLERDGRAFVLLVERRLTEQKKLEARIIHQEKMAAFGLLAAGIAHDMGNPLNAIGVQLQLIDDDLLAPPVREIVATVKDETERLRRILRELVDFARRRRDEASLISVQSVVSDAVRLLRHDRRSRDVRVTEDYDSEAPPVFMVEDHLMQVILNLMINALDAMAGTGTLRIELRGSGANVVLRVHDTGQGMERSVLERCFEPLFTTKRAGEGTGLGLSISKDIVTAAGGRIELHSAPRQGTTAVVVLPAAVEATQVGSAATSILGRAS